MRTGVKWAAELADDVLVNDRANTGARRVEAQALIAVRELQMNAIAQPTPRTATRSPPVVPST